ncbi:hypothetical protein [Sporosarcina sp. FSL K6-5500]|uniref:hypothetical protein n=1 Tax=Sporosarcina sp. FSL K6-5500 TaxID=2921558 RepID=UPI0030F932A9
MIYTVTMNPKEINFSPATVLEEIFQNVYTIISTTFFSVPLFREFGTSAAYLDNPNIIAQSKLVGEIIEKVELYESRVIVEEVRFASEQMDGFLQPILSIRIKEGVKIT